MPDLPIGWRIVNEFNENGTMRTFDNVGVRYSTLLLQRAHKEEDPFKDEPSIAWTTVSKRAVPMNGISDKEMDAFVHSLVTEAQYQEEAEKLLLGEDDDEVLPREDGWATAR